MSSFDEHRDPLKDTDSEQGPLGCLGVMLSFVVPKKFLEGSGKESTIDIEKEEMRVCEEQLRRLFDVSDMAIDVNFPDSVKDLLALGLDDDDHFSYNSKRWSKDQFHGVHEEFVILGRREGSVHKVGYKYEDIKFFVVSSSTRDDLIKSGFVQGELEQQLITFKDAARYFASVARRAERKSRREES